MNDDRKFHYLNLENAWPLFELSGLQIGDQGELTLARVPQVEAEVTEPLPPVPALEGPAGIGVDAQGNLYVADPVNHRILRVDACDGSLATLPCLRGPGREPGQLNGPRGVLVGPRDALYVADSGNHRVQVVDLRTLQLRAIWGQPDPYAEPEPGDAPGRFNEPWDLASDAAGCVYVADHGNRRIQKFDADGRVIPAFWETMRTQPTVPQEPTHITTVLLDGEERLLILDQPPRLQVYRLDGIYDADATARWAQVAAHVGLPAGAAAHDDRLYVGDAASRRVLVFDRDGTFVGMARGYEGPVAGLALDHRGRLLIHPGAGGAVTRLVPGQAYVETGTFLAGPFAVSDQPTRWHRLQALADPLPTGVHIRLFTCTSNTDMPPPPLPGQTRDNLDGQALAPPGEWRAVPWDLLDILALNAPARDLWIGGMLQGDGTASPVLRQMRIEYNHETWLRYLPAIYSQDGPGHLSLEHVLALFQSLLTDLEAKVGDLPRLFDPWAVPNDDAPRSWLDWLAGWLAFELDERWEEATRRSAVAGAFALQARRGTREGLRELLAFYTDTTAHITEPGRYAGLWALDGEQSVLGFTTMLAPAHAQGAVVGTTATLDQSHLIGDEDYGAPLFEDVAHRFCVQVYAAELADPDAVEKVRQVLDREKPAHTTYHLCLIEPRMRVGFQARVGIDTIVGGPPPDLILDEPRQLGLDTVLSEPPDRRPVGGTIGQDARVGRRTTLM